MATDKERTARALARVLRRQDGVISRAQALAAGMSAATIDRRTASRRWRVVGPRVYQVADREDTARARVIAAMLSLGADATLMGRTAAWWWRLLDSPPASVEIAVDAARRPRDRPGVALLHRTIDVQDRAVIAGLAVTKKPLTLLDAAPRLGLVDGARLVDRALLREAVTLEALRDAHQRTAGRCGTDVGRELLRLAADGARSQAERTAHDELRAGGVTGWAPNAEIDVPGFGRVVGDIVFAQRRLIVEVDGWAYHRDQRAFLRDAARQNALVAAGWTVVRTNWYELMEEPWRFISTVRRTLLTKI